MTRLQRLLILLSFLVASAPMALAQPDIEVSPEDLSFEVETRFILRDTLFVTNAGDAPLLVNVTTEIGDFLRPASHQQRLAPDLYERDLRLRGSYSASLQDLLSRAEGGEPLRLLVELDVPFMAEGYLRSGEVTAQRAEIEAAQEAVLNDLAGSQAEAVRRFKYVPYLALRADAEGLRRLAAHPSVVRILEDEMEAPHLEESTVVVGAPVVWDLGFAGEGEAVAILDTGSDNDHPFLADKIVAEACFSSGNSVCPGGGAEEIGPGTGDDTCEQGSNISSCDHGTHVAGIAAGSTDGFYGVARDADIIALQVFSRVDIQSQCGQNPAPCLLAFQSDIIGALEYVFELSNGGMEIASANMSLGGGGSSAPCPGDPREPISAQLTSVGVAVVSSAGNGGRTGIIGAPACAPSIVSVGSTGDGSFGTAVDGVSGFSDIADFMDLFAPGDRIRSSVPNNQYANFLGTSMSSPHVAGAFAILQQANPEMSVAQALGALKVGGIPITTSRMEAQIPRIQIDFALLALNWLGSPVQEVEVAAGETVAIPVLVNGLPLQPGDYTGTITLSSNDPDEATVTVPVALTVTPPAPIELQIESRNPDADVLIAISPADLSGSQNGMTPVLRVYPRGTDVTMTADPSPGDDLFSYWSHNGEIIRDRRVTFSLGDPALWTVFYSPGDNAAPIANPDSVATLQGEGIEIPVLANDSDPEGDVLAVAGLAGTIHGVATILEDQNVNYVPDPDFVGTDVFTYFLVDEFGALDEAEVVVEVTRIVGTEGESAVPSAFAVRGNYPNPFAQTTQLRFDLPEAAQVEVTVYDLLGREVLRVPAQAAVAGFDRVVALKAGTLPSGVYVYRATATSAERVHTGSGRFAIVR